MQPEINLTNPDENIYLTKAVSQLQDLVKSVSSSNALTEKDKVERAKKVSEIIAEIFADLGSYGQAHFENLAKIAALAQQAEQMQLLTSYRTTAYNHHLAQIRAFPLDLTITTKDGEIKANSYLLKKYSPEFKVMLEPSMSEGQEGKIKLTDYSSATIQFLMDSLTAKSRFESTPSHPLNNELALELFDLSMRYGIADWLYKNPSFAEFMDSELFTNNAEAWFNCVDPYIDNPGRDAENQLVNALIEKITPPLLDIDIKPFNRKFLIPAECIDLFFNEDTRDLMPRLPVVLDLKNQEDLAVFRKACEEANLKAPLKMNVLMRAEMHKDDHKHLEEKALTFASRPSSSQQSNVDVPKYNWAHKKQNDTLRLAKQHQVEINFIWPIPKHTHILWDHSWQLLFNIPISIEAPLLPANIGEILNSACPFENSRSEKIHDIYRLLFIPGIDAGVDLALLKTQLYMTDDADIDNCIQLPDSSHWVLMKIHNLAAYDNDEGYVRSIEGYAKSEAFLAATPDYEAPDLLSAIITVRLRPHLRYSKSPYRIVCKEKHTNSDSHLLVVENADAKTPPSIRLDTKDMGQLVPLRRFF